MMFLLKVSLAELGQAEDGNGEVRFTVDLKPSLYSSIGIISELITFENGNLHGKSILFPTT